MDQSTRYPWPYGRPLLPSSESVARYAALSDQNRQYTNGGPLLRQFEERLADLFSVSQRNVVAVSSGSSAVSLAILAQSEQAFERCIIPGWTFVATANATHLAGCNVNFTDVDQQTWTINPDAGIDLPEAEHVIVVSPFGAPMDIDSWATESSKTGTKIAIDAAAAFDAVARCGMIHPSGIPVAISFHATKAFGIGEGGCVVTADADLAERVRAMSNHGFDRQGKYVGAGMNGKLSELQAAVGLAALDHWPERREAWEFRSAAYRKALETIGSISCQPGYGGNWVSSNCCVRVPGRADRIIAALAIKGIEARRPWGEGAYRIFSGQKEAHPTLPNSDALAASVVGLPIHVDMSESSIDMIVNEVGEALETDCRASDG